MPEERNNVAVAEPSDALPNDLTEFKGVEVRPSALPLLDEPRTRLTLQILNIMREGAAKFGVPSRLRVERFGLARKGDNELMVTQIVPGTEQGWRNYSDKMEPLLNNWAKSLAPADYDVLENEIMFTIDWDLNDPDY